MVVGRREARDDVATASSTWLPARQRLARGMPGPLRNLFAGMIFSGPSSYNQEQQEHGSREQISVLSYLSTGDFVEDTFENWESEFLQMGMYVVLTAFLYQRGSSESKPLNEPVPQDQDPRKATANQSTPWPVRRGVGS